MEEKPRPTLIDLVSTEIGRGQLVEVVGGLLTDDDRFVLGEQAAEKVTKCIVAMAGFVPEPATFDEGAYNEMIGWRLYGDDTEERLVTDEMVRVLQISMDLGVVVPAPIEGRLMVPADVHPIIRSILGRKS